MKELTVQAVEENLSIVTAFVNETLHELNCSKRTRIQIDVAVDEVFANVVNYAYGTEKGPISVRIDTEEEPRAVVISFSDRGKAFDPLAVSAPDTGLPLKKRQIGGLGVFLLKRSMDDVQYENRDGQNILTIRKRIS